MFTQVQVSAVKVGQRFRKQWGDLRSLRASIRRLGVLKPIIIDATGKLVCGMRRLEACRAEGIETIPARIMDLDETTALVAEQDENNEREPFTMEERVQIARAIEEREKGKAKERQAATQAKAGEKVGSHKGSEKFSEPYDKGEAKDKAASAVGMSRPTYEKAKAVVEAAEADSEHRDLVEQMNETGKVTPAHRELQERNGKHEPKQPKNGKPTFDDRGIDDQIGKLVRLFDARADRKSTRLNSSH